MADGTPSQNFRPDNRLAPVLRALSLLSIAFDFKKLALAAVGIVLLAAGWWLLDLGFGSTHPMSELLAAARAPALVTPSPAGQTSLMIAHSWFSLFEPYLLLAIPFATLINWSPAGQSGSVIASIHATLSLIWAIVVWSMVGGAISRMAAIQLSQLRKPGLGETFAYTKARVLDFIIAPLCPLLGIAVGILAGLPFGLLYWVPLIGPILAGLLFFIPLAIGVVITLLATGLIAGWPLFPAAIAAGADDPLDALSRVFSYLNQRLGLVAIMLVVTGLVGGFGLILANFFTEVLIHVSQWIATLLAPASVTAEMFGSTDSPGLVTRLHAAWMIALRLVPHAWIHAYFWSAAALIYLTLRRDVDGTQWDEIEPPTPTLTNPIPISPQTKSIESAAEPSVATDAL